ncbi:MAG TPA: hypothetical protein VIB39_23650 [Candidatus Angelobacter sp.]|jgi:hypothetical protein
MGFTTMNLIFEGPFIFMMDNPQVRVLAPRVDGHRYMINGADAPASTYMLSGVAGIGDVQKTQYELPPGADAFWLSAGQLHLSLNPQESAFFTFVLPAPQKVVALRSRAVEIVDAFGNQRSAVMPTTYAFVYNVSDPAALALNPDTGWRPQSGAQSRFANLSVAAGLPLDVQDPTGQHAHIAFTELKSFLPGLSMEILSTGAEVNSGTVEGLPEIYRRGNQSQRHSERVAKVVTAVFKNDAPRATLRTVSAVLDCQSGGVGVHHP